jgi:hypothetical protein
MTLAQQVIARFGTHMTDDNGLAILKFGNDTSPDCEGWHDAATNKIFLRYADGSRLVIDTTTHTMQADSTH